MSCACVKADRVCQGCLPSHLDTCSNQHSSVSAMVLPSFASSIPLPGTSLASADSLPTLPLTLPIDSCSSISVLSPSLPGWPVQPLQQPDFLWGPFDGVSFGGIICTAYEKVVHWIPNLLFLLGRATGVAFVKELAHLFQSYSDSLSYECMVMNTITVLQQLLLQKPTAGPCKSKVLIDCLQIRLTLWSNGDIEGLLSEGSCLQKSLSHSRQRRGPKIGSIGDYSQAFTSHVKKGDIHGALNSLSFLIPRVFPVWMIKLTLDLPAS